MKLSPEHMDTLLKLAITAAKEAGRIIADRADSTIAVSSKTGGDTRASQIVTEVDHLAQQHILNVLLPSCKEFDLGLLAEESADDRSRFEKDWFWCIDPLDGTLPFVESKNGYSVSIALVSKNGEPVIGVVYDPVTETLYHGSKEQGAFRNGEHWEAPSSASTSTEVFTLIGDRSLKQHPLYPNMLAELTAFARERGLRRVVTILHGGAAMNACWTLENAPACYFKFPKAQAGGGSLWDFAATACIFQEHGGTVSDIHGAPFDLNRLDSTFMNHRGVLFATDNTIADYVRRISSRIEGQR